MRRKKTDKQWYCLPFKVLHSMYLVMHPWLDAGVWQTAGCSQQHLCRHFHRSSLQGSLSHITRGLKVPFLLPEGGGGGRRSCQLTRQGSCFGFMQQTGTDLSITPPAALTCRPYSIYPPTPPGTAANWAVQSGFFLFLPPSSGTLPYPVF